MSHIALFLFCKNIQTCLLSNCDKATINVSNVLRLIRQCLQIPVLIIHALLNLRDIIHFKIWHFYFGIESSKFIFWMHFTIEYAWESSLMVFIIPHLLIIFLRFITSTKIYSKTMFLSARKNFIAKLVPDKNYH